MGYSIENFKEALQKSMMFIDVIKARGYNSIDGTISSFWFEKQVNKTECFKISVSTQISGFVSASLEYSKKLDESTDTLTIKQHLSTLVDDLDTKIKSCELKCLEIGSKF